MDCEKAFEYMSLYLDKELDRADSEELMSHLNSCSKCCQEFHILKDMIEQLNTVPLIELPEGYHEELMEKIQKIQVEEIFPINQQKQVKKKKTGWKKYSVLAAAFFILLLVGGSTGSLLLNFKNEESRMYTNQKVVSSTSEYQNDSYSVAPQEYDGALSDTASMPMENKMAKTASMPMEDTETEELAAEEAGTYKTTGEQVQQDTMTDNRMKIKSMQVSMSVDNFDTAITRLQQTVSQNGGYTENFYSNVYYTDKEKDIYLKEGAITLKMPSENYEQTKSILNEIGTISNTSETTDDVTSQYIDTQGKLKVKRIEEERLLEFLSKGETIEDILKIEDRLAQVRTEIESYTTAIQNWDKLVQFSTIHITLTEEHEDVGVSVPSGFTAKIKNSFIGSINQFVGFSQTLAIGLAGAVIPILVLVIIALVSVLVIKKINHKNKKDDKNKKEEEVK